MPSPISTTSPKGREHEVKLVCLFLHSTSISLSSRVFVQQKRKGPRLSGSIEYSSLRGPLSRPTLQAHSPSEGSGLQRKLQACIPTGRAWWRPGEVANSSAQRGVGWWQEGECPPRGGQDAPRRPQQSGIPQSRSLFRGSDFLVKRKSPQLCCPTCTPKVYPETELRAALIIRLVLGRRVKADLGGKIENTTRPSG